LTTFTEKYALLAVESSNRHTRTIWRHVLRSLDCKSVQSFSCQLSHSSKYTDICCKFYTIKL